MIPNQPIEKLNQVARYIVENKIFTHLHCRDEDEMRLVFMLFAIADKATIQELVDDKVGLLYEYWSNAVPGRYINGLPIFLSCYYLNEHDTKIVLGKVRKIYQVTEEALKETSCT